VVDVNPFGGELKQYQVVVDPQKLRARSLTLTDVTSALSAASVSVGGGYVERAGESYTIRGSGLVKNEADIGDVVVRTTKDGPAVLVKHLGRGAHRLGAPLRRRHLGRRARGRVRARHDARRRKQPRRRDGRKREGRRDRERPTSPACGSRSSTIARTSSGARSRRWARTSSRGLLIVTVVLAVMLGTVRGRRRRGPRDPGVDGDRPLRDAPLRGHRRPHEPRGDRLRLLGRRPDRHLGRDHRRDGRQGAHGPREGASLRGREQARGEARGVRGGHHHARVHPAFDARRRRREDVPPDGHHDGVRALRCARLLGGLLPGARDALRAAREGARAQVARGESRTRTSAWS
jgi:hypothetical protein